MSVALQNEVRSVRRIIYIRKYLISAAFVTNVLNGERKKSEKSHIHRRNCNRKTRFVPLFR